MSAKVEVILVPPDIGTTTSSLEKLSTRFRTARLRALQEYPEAFNSIYETESRFEDEVWANRLQNQNARSFVAICPGPSEADRSTGDDIEKLAENEWRGMIVLLGPKTRPIDGSDSMTASENTASTSSTLANQAVVYHAVSMFVLPEMQRQGLGIKLVEKSIKAVRQEAAPLMAKRLNIELDVHAENKSATRFYKRCGFKLPANDEPTLEEPERGGREMVGMCRIVDLG